MCTIQTELEGHTLIQMACYIVWSVTVEMFLSEILSSTYITCGQSSNEGCFALVVTGY